MSMKSQAVQLHNEPGAKSRRSHNFRWHIKKDTNRHARRQAKRLLAEAPTRRYFRYSY